ncbi:MAG: isoprenyl transferase [Saprospiraceae bacterium]|nr:isoprenyl transferase [Saprospiraceae bacterium]MBK8450575.1 isoprenyl transferase [Saprospiraceae bacterium]MBK8485345.1 isoprenyl transferase [Saprospiraceae bacterium]MBK9222563.1 isoprenyl transferase [Saprospiraceae bacterium]MBK9720404.1 isoprenyl transferase [Saprospiraceae bacterium]
MESRNISEIDPNKLPKHIAIIMDGNGRWAKRNGLPRLFGHKTGVKTVREIAEASAELGIKYLTLYAFSTENWNRPQLEVKGLMSLLVETLKHELSALEKNKIRLRAIGDLSMLPKSTQDALNAGMEKTNQNTRMDLILALNYSSRWEILKAVNLIAQNLMENKIQAPINESQFSSFLSTHGIPDPELLIRTSGEHRISNFLLWQLAYTELYFTPVFWPEFKKEHLYEAILDYQGRQRRFGKISEQLS